MSTPASAPAVRVRALNHAEVAPGGDYVLYWMTAARRTRSNHALDHAIALAHQLDRPLVVLEGLRCGYPWASPRLHAFVLQGMRDNAQAFEGTGVLYHPYVEPEPGAGSGLLRRLAQDACAVVADDFPAFFLPRMHAVAAEEHVKVRMEAVDSNGLLPLRATQRVFARAVDLRRFLQRELKPHLVLTPRLEPLRGLELRALAALPDEVTRRWPAASKELLAADPAALAGLPLEHDVPVVDLEGGARSGRRILQRFIDERLEHYGEGRNHPDEDAASGLSPFLHFGHVSAYEVLHAVARREDWSTEKVRAVRSGAREGWWGMSTAAESFLDELVTWRELGLNFATHRDDLERYESLPSWARETLEQHAGDERPYLYTHEQFDRAETHDELWNAAQTELRETGRMHNYMRMLWGKKILHWSASPREALEIMVDLNNRYALDGRDPNSYSGIFWVLGRYDRPWGPEREVFGKVRYMSAKNTRRKLHLDRYLATWGRSSEPEGLFAS